MANNNAVVNDLSSFFTILQTSPRCLIVFEQGGYPFDDYILLVYVYKAYLGIGTPILNPMGNINMIYEGKINTDKWYPVRLMDSADPTFARSGVTVASVTVTYGFEGAVAETPYAIVAADWKEQGNGNYWLNIGAGEFTQNGKYTVKVRTYPIAYDVVFNVEVRDFMVTETIANAPISNQGLALAGTLSTIQLAITASAVNNYYNGSTVVIVGGTGIGQSRIIDSYNGLTTTATVDPDWKTAPDNTSVYKVIPLGSSPIDLVAIESAILDADLQLHLGAGVGFRNIGNVLGQLAQSEFELRTNVFATIPVIAQGIDASMVARGCIQYQQVDMSYTKNWAVPDRTYYLLYHYDAQRRNDVVKASLGIVW
jgi:hypothetical protein